MTINNIENIESVKVIVLRSTGNFFSSGMDFSPLSDEEGTNWIKRAGKKYIDLLLSFTLSSKIFIAVVEGRVNAGGVGLIAACDIVIAGRKASFSLSEALFGLIPANVLPFLIRRVGFQKAYWMSITTNVIYSKEAWQIGLVDEYHKTPEDLLRKQLLRILKVNPDAIRRLKTYTSTMWNMDEKVKQAAIDQLTEMSMDPKIHKKIKDFVEKGMSPWER